MDRRAFLSTLMGALVAAPALLSAPKAQRTLPNRHARKRMLREKQRALIMEAFRRQCYVADQMDVYSEPIYDTVTF